MPSVEFRGKLVYFAHCPKAGGTSVERFMVDRWGSAVRLLGWGWDRKWARRGAGPGEPPCSPQHLVWEDALHVLPRRPDHVFTLVRDPVARMVSEYLYQAEGRLTGPAGRPVRHLGFGAWLRLMLAMAARNPYTHDNHFRGQVEFIPRDGVTVFRLEDGLEPVLRWLCALAGEAPPAALPHDLRAGARRRRPEPSAEDKVLIQRQFLADYERFGYPASALEPAGGGEVPGLSPLTRAAAGVLDRLYRRGLV